MPKPRKNYSDIKKLGKAINAWGSGGAAVRAFLPEGENNPQELTTYAKTLKERMATLGIKYVIREGLGSFLFACMLGQVDDKGNPKYKISDVMNPDGLVEEKKKLYADIESLLANKPNHPTEKEKRQVVTWMLRGLKRSCEQVEKKTIENIKNNDISNFYTIEMSVLAGLNVSFLTNNIQECYSKGVLVPGSLIDICQSQYEDDKKIKHTVQEEVLGAGNTFVDFVKKYEGMNAFATEFSFTSGGFVSTVEDTSNFDIFLGISSYLAFERAHRNYINNPNIEMNKLFPTMNLGELKEKVKNNGITNPTTDELAAFDYAFYMIDAADENEEKAVIGDNAKDSLYRYGMTVKILNGEAYKNLSVNSSRLDDNASVSFDKSFDRKSILKAAFLSDMEIGEYYHIDEDISDIDEYRYMVSGIVSKLQRLTGNVFSADLMDYDDRLTELSCLIKEIPNTRRLSTHKEFTDKVNSFYKMFESKKGSPLYDETDEDVAKRLGLDKDEVANRKNAVLEKANSILNNSAKAGTELDDIEKQLYTHYVMQEANASIKKAGSLEAIATRAAMRTKLLENGARFPKINDYDSLGYMKDIAQERYDEIKEFNKKLRELKPKGGASKEWKSMCQTAEKAEQLSKKFLEEDIEFYDCEDEESIKKYRDSVEQLNSAMRIVQCAAKKYVHHKVDTNGLDEGTKDYERLQCAKRLESFGDQQGTYLTKKLTAEMNDIHREKGYFCAESINKDCKRLFEMNKKLQELREKTVTSSRESREMADSINKLLTFQANLITKLQNGGKLTQEDDKSYYGYTNSKGIKEKGYVEKALDKVNAYINHRLEKNDFKGFYGDRFDMAVRMRIYLGITQNGAEKTREVREAAYENKRKEIDRKELEKERADVFNKSIRTAKAEMKALCDAARAELGNIKIDQKTAFNEETANKVREHVYVIWAKLKYDEEKAKVAAQIIKPEGTTVLKHINAGKYDLAVNAIKEDKIVKGFVEKHADKIMIAEDMVTNVEYQKYKEYYADHEAKLQENAKEAEGKLDNQEPKAVRK